MARILLAEDEPDARIPMVHFLRDGNHDVIDVFDPEQAIEALGDAQTRGEPFDVIILDIIMPPDDPDGGKKVLEFMVREKIRSRVILATAYGYNGPADRLRTAFADLVCEVLTKTFTDSELDEAIRRVLKKRSRKEKKHAGRVKAAIV